MLRGFTKWSSLAKPVMRHRQWARNFSYVPEKVRNVAIIAHVDHGDDHCSLSLIACTFLLLTAGYA